VKKLTEWQKLTNFPELGDRGYYVSSKILGELELEARGGDSYGTYSPMGKEGQPPSRYRGEGFKNIRFSGGINLSRKKWMGGL